MSNYKSQWQQDFYLNKYVFDNRKHGIFVDVGAHDGVDGSNSYFFEKELEWTGLCIEPMNDCYEELCKNRSAVCLNCCVYKENKDVEFVQNSGFTEMLSGIKDTLDPRHVDRTSHEQKLFGGESKTITKKAYTLSEILEKHNLFHVDYLSVDTEGSEYEILQGIDFSKFSIGAITVENNYQTDFALINSLLVSNGFTHVTTLCADEVYVHIENVQEKINQITP